LAISTEDAKRAIMAFHRFGLGAKPGGLTADMAKDPRGALIGETRAPEKILIKDPDLLSTTAAVAKFFEHNKMERAMRMASADDNREQRVARGRSQQMAATAPPSGGMEMGAGMGMVPPQGMAQPQGMAPGTPPGGQPNRPAQQNQPPEVPQQIFRQEVMARFRMVTEPEIGFAERLATFWANHFCVSATKSGVNRVTSGSFEREAIRPHVFGKFSDMLLAVQKHPAMLFYLDNQQSVGPASQAGRNRRLGLNENLAREILELHTLGVNGGYKQADVTSLARIITGWGMVGEAQVLGPAGSFVFTPQRHEPGDQVVLGKTYPAGGVEQGEAALRDLARHPSTARHIAVKLARHFVADQPPQPLIDRLEKVFRDTDGDLAEISRALVSHDEAWKGELTKLRSPFEWLSAIARFAGPPKEWNQILQPMRVLGQPLWEPPGPNGFPDTAAHWSSAENIRSRLDVSLQQARRMGDRFHPGELAEQLFASGLSSETAQAIRRAETKQQGLAILMMSPEFQRR
jgi:uncharacterized protein (DUF1800 family)